MSFFPKPGEIKDDDDLYELSGDEDDRLRSEYEFDSLNYMMDESFSHVNLYSWYNSFRAS